MVLATTARGPLSPPPSPPLTLMPRLIPTTDTTAMDTDMVSDTTVLDTVPTDTVLAATATAMVCTDTTDKCPAIHPKTSLGITSSSSEKWIAQFGLTPTSATSFSATRLAQAVFWMDGWTLIRSIRTDHGRSRSGQDRIRRHGIQDRGIRDHIRIHGHSIRSRDQPRHQR